MIEQQLKLLYFYFFKLQRMSLHFVGNYKYALKNLQFSFIL